MTRQAPEILHADRYSALPISVGSGVFHRPDYIAGDE